MRGSDQAQGSMFSYVSLESRIPADHPLRPMREMVDAALRRLSRVFSGLYANSGRPSIPPERLLRALLLQVLYSIRSERQLMEQLEYNLLYRWFVGLGIDDPVWVPTVFTKNRTGSWRVRSQRPSSTRCWAKPATITCCLPSTSRWTAR